MYLRAAGAGHAVMVVLQILEHAWSWSIEWLEGMQDYDLRMVESGPEALLPLTAGMTGRVRRLGACRIVSETLYSPVRALVRFCTWSQSAGVAPTWSASFRIILLWGTRTQFRRIAVSKVVCSQV